MAKASPTKAKTPTKKKGPSIKDDEPPIIIKPGGSRSRRSKTSLAIQINRGHRLIQRPGQQIYDHSERNLTFRRIRFVAAGTNTAILPQVDLPLADVGDYWIVIEYS
jgi:hypothetical protein